MQPVVRRILKSGLFLVWTCLITFLLLEGALRLVGYASENVYDPIYAPHEAPDIPYVHAAGLRNAQARGHAVIDTDELGLRCEADRVVPDGAARIAVVGDSVTFGEGVHETADTYCAVLERELGTPVYNFGVSAYSVREMAATAEARVGAVDPDLVLMAVITHDLKFDRTPEVDRWGYHYNARLSGWMSRDSFLKRAMRGMRSAYLVRNVVQLLRAREGGETASPPFPGPPSEEVLSHFLRFDEVCRARGWEHAVVLLPELEPERNVPLKTALEAEGIPIIDVSALRGEFTFEEYCASPADRHPSAAVHGAIGRALAEALTGRI